MILANCHSILEPSFFDYKVKDSERRSRVGEVEREYEMRKQKVHTNNLVMIIHFYENLDGKEHKL